MDFPSTGSSTNLLQNISVQDGEVIVPTKRVIDVGDAYAIAYALFSADTTSSLDRSQHMAMLDGAEPYDSDELVRLGQGSRTNLNFGEAMSDFETAKAPYIESIHGTDRLLNVTIDYGTDSQRQIWEPIIAEELHNTITRWNKFDYESERLISEFIAHGVGVWFYEGDIDWRGRAAGMEDFKFPRSCKAKEDEIECVMARRSYLPHELYNHLRDASAAEKAGWNIKEAINQIIMAFPDDQGRYYSMERIERMLKDQDLWMSYGVARPRYIHTFHLLVKEFDQSMSHYILSENAPNDYIYSCNSRFPSPKSAYILFTYGIGNGDLHSIRGLLYKIYPHIQISNQLQCQMVDNAKLSSALILQPKDAESMEDMGISYLGAIAVLPPNLNVVQASVNNTSMPAMQLAQYLGQVRMNNTGGYQAQGVQQPGEAQQTATQVRADLAHEGTLSSSSMNLFYNPWGSMLKETVRRICRKGWLAVEPGADEAIDCLKRVLMRGVPEEAFYSIIHVEPVRAIGRGSPGQRLLNSQMMMQLMQYMPPEGVNTTVRNLMAQILGSMEQVDKYLPRFNAQQTPSLDQKIAELENSEMNQGTTPTLQGDNSVHAQSHAQDLSMMVQAMEQGQMQAEQFVKIASIKVPHLAQHLNPIQGDSNRIQMVGQIKQVLEAAAKLLNQLQNVLKQHQEKAQQQQMKAMQGAMAAQQGGPQMSPKDQLEMQNIQSIIAERQQKMQIESANAKINLQHAQQKTQIEAVKAHTHIQGSQQKIQNESAKTQQDLQAGHQQMAINDLTTAQQVRQNNTSSAT